MVNRDWRNFFHHRLIPHHLVFRNSVCQYSERYPIYTKVRNEQRDFDHYFALSRKYQDGAITMKRQ